MVQSEPDDLTTPDAISRSWVNAMPAAVRPYLRLMRADRPIGTWLLLWPCWWSIALASPQGRWPDPVLLILFGIGAILMRGAGCTLNDIVDRDFDSRVERTRARPIPSGQVSVNAAVAFCILLCLTALIILLQFNAFAIAVGISSLALVAIYPFMKRFTYWPQLVLGLTFNWGALLGWAAVKGELGPAPLLLYVGGIFWTLGYDTIYAHQDKADDLLVGIRSSALKLGGRTKPWLVLLYLLALGLFAAAGYLAYRGPVFYVACVLLAGQFAWQVRHVDIDDSTSCLRVFKSNTYAGWILFLGLALANAPGLG